MTHDKFHLQDFGDTIPGHGGIMDRFDCQFLMATFVNVYISSFIRIASPQKLLSMVSHWTLKCCEILFVTHLTIPNIKQVYGLKPEQQLQLFHQLKDNLESRNILQ